MLHGNGEDSTYFSHQIAYFQKSYRVIAIDTRGHGKTPRGEEPFTISQFADDLYVFMKQHEIRRADMLGFSDGANIALLFTIRHPERVNRLILRGEPESRRAAYVGAFFTDEGVPGGEGCGG